MTQLSESSTDTSGPAAPLRRRLALHALRWPTLAKLGLWYLLLLLPTLYFKYSYLNALAGEGVLAAISSGSTVQAVIRYVTLFDTDFVQVLLLTAGLYVIGHLLLRISIDMLAAISVLVCMLVSAGNWLSFLVIGSLLNADNLQIALSWIWQHPEAMTADDGGKLLLLSSGGLLLLASLWATACFLGIRGGVSERNAVPIARATLGMASVLQLIAGSNAIYDATHPHRDVGTSRGYWSSTLASLRGAEQWAPLALKLPPKSQIQSDYRAIVYDSPTAADSTAAPFTFAQIPSNRRLPKHIVFISLETAARKYYPLGDDPGLPNFARMASRGIVSDYHLSTNPATTWAIYSMLTGTYPRRGRSLLDYGDFASDGLASTLGARGYETTFIDSYRIDWQAGLHRDHNSRMVKDLGFMSIEDITTDTASHFTGEPFDVAVARERRSLQRALDRIDVARAHHTHAFVFIATILGHFPWNARATEKNHTGAAKLATINRTLDTLIGEFLAGIEKRALSDSVIVVVTGDHGLRTRGEFKSLGEKMHFGTISFNVPLIIYAPGIFDRGVRLARVTSHVDIAPTLYDLVGVSADTLLLHGSSVLDPTTAGRTTFMFNNSLRPIDGYYRKGWLYVYNAFTGDARAERALGGANDTRTPQLSSGVEPSAAFDTAVAETLDRAAGIFDTTSAYFLQRGARMNSPANNTLGAAH